MGSNSEDSLSANECADGSTALDFIENKTDIPKQFDADTLLASENGGFTSISLFSLENDSVDEQKDEDINPEVKIDLSKESLELVVGKNYTLTATLDPADATGTIVWESSDSAVATVTDGVVTAVSMGKATITAQLEDGTASATCEVTVIAETTSEGIESFSFTVNNPAVSGSVFGCDTLQIQKVTEGVYQLTAPTYALGDNVYKPELTIQAPSELGKEFSVSYESYSGMGFDTGKVTVHSVNGKVTIKNYGTMYGDTQVKNPSKIFIQLDGCTGR